LDLLPALLYVASLVTTKRGYNQAMAKAKPPNPSFSRIRQAIMKIPRGRVSSYGAIAAAAGIPGGARLVVRVLNQSHGLPWHRVVAAGGRIALPGEHGLDQRFRLEMEGVKFNGRKVRMREFEFKFSKKKVERRRPRLR
jgi:methylated-DNA-protein-cysteine methyltransferase-like protein